MVMEVTRVVNDGDNCLLSDLLANMEDSEATLMKQQGVFSISRQSCFIFVLWAVLCTIYDIEKQ